MHRRYVSGVTLVVEVGGTVVLLLLSLVMIRRVLLVRLLNGMRLLRVNRRLELVGLLLLLLLLLSVRSSVVTAVVVMHRLMLCR